MSDNDRTLASGVHEGVEYKVLAPYNPDQPRYPYGDGTHVWGCWPVVAIEKEGKPLLAVETGGYCDLEAVDPYTGRLIHGRVWENGISAYDALRKLIDIMEAARFLDSDETGPAPVSP